MGYRGPMKAVHYSEFGGPITIEMVPDPAPEPGGVVIQVEATGLCRSDWHGWMGHDPDIVLPHVPGHEFAGVIVETGNEVNQWKRDDRVTLPFCCGCGSCSQCESGNQHICDRHFQPGFTHWGSFAPLVAISYAQTNLVRLPETMDFNTAASLGCRFSTSYRAVVDQGTVQPGQWVAIHGCGGVGLSAVMIASAKGAKVLAIDINDEKLEKAIEFGADATINTAESDDVIAQILDLTGGGAHLSIDALGHPETFYHSVAGLRKRGKHVQVGLLSPADQNAPVPTHLIVSRELEILGSHGMQAHRYPEMMELILSGALTPQSLLGDTISLREAPERLAGMDRFEHTGVVLIDRFD